MAHSHRCRPHPSRAHWEANAHTNMTGGRIRLWPERPSLNRQIIRFNKPFWKHEKWKAPSSQMRGTSLSDIAGSHKKAQWPTSTNLSGVIERHSLLMCLYFFCTQQASWPLIRQVASREETVTVESFLGEITWAVCAHTVSLRLLEEQLLWGGADCEGAHVPINIEFLGLHLDKPDKVITSFWISPQQIQRLGIL